MPKGDRVKLKADPEDGTTPVANLLLEAVAMVKLSGLQIRAIIYLWRETYGWVGEGGKRKKESKITLSQWAKALDSISSRLSHSLAELAEKNIINRRMADAWGGYYYSINTNISKWNSDSINLSKLADRVGIADFGTVAENATIIDLGDSCGIDNSYPKQHATVAQNATLGLPKTQQHTIYKEILNKDKEKGDVLEKPTSDVNEIIKDIIDKSPYGEGLKLVFSGIDKLRGYKPPKRNAEAKAIRNMLKNGYTPDQILKTWETLKQDKFWQDKELFMMSVETQIGAISKNGGARKDSPRRLPTHYTNPEDL